MQSIDDISGAVLDTSIRLHGFAVERQKPVDITFDDMSFDAAFRIDLLVNDKVLVEVKSVERLNAAHTKQVLTYLRLTKRPLGLLVNFGGATLMEGFKRFLND